jgi:hypothetical protein
MVRLTPADLAAQHPMVTVLRPALRACLTSPRMPAGSRVICVADDPLPVVRLLCHLGLEGVGLCSRPEQVMLCRRDCGEAEFQPLSSVDRLAHSSDLVLYLGVSGTHGNLLDASARQMTAQLLSMLKPLGRMVFLHRHAEVATAAHTADCWPRHLACFPGEVSTQTVNDRSIPAAVWQWLTRRGPHRATTLITFEAPLEYLSVEEWRDYARRGLLTGQRACCETAAALSALKVARAA